MNVKISRSLGIIAALYFTANFNAQTTPRDTVSKEQKIEEVVVIGYGSVKKSNLTSAVSTVKAETFDDRPISNIAQAIQGNAAGVNVVQPSGKPGGTMEVKIRGNTSLTSNTTPLYVVDGIQTNDISGINPDDIVDMTILKDATSTAIYGINGSSGVVLVTTKRAKYNKSQLGFNAFWGFSKQVDNIEVLNLDQYKTLMGEINPSYFTTINNPMYNGINTNWREKVYQTGFDQNYNVNYSFGNENVKAYTSLGYQGIDGVIKPASFDRYSFKVNLDANIAKWLKLNTSLSYIKTNLNNTNDNLSSGRGGVVLSALNTPSFLPVYGTDVNSFPTDSNGNVLPGYLPGQFAPNPFQSSSENPVAYQSRLDKTWNNRFMSILGLDISLAKNLTFKPSISLDYIDTNKMTFTDAYQTSYGRAQFGTGGDSNSTWQNILYEGTLNYALRSGKSDWTFLLGGNIRDYKYRSSGRWGSRFSEDVREFVYDLAEQKHYGYGPFGPPEDVREISSFARAIYTYDNKYTVMGIIKAQASSALAPGKKWGYFPGVSAAWVISNEDFLKDNNILSYLKLRGGWGKAGNATGIPAYSSFNYTTISEFGNDSNGNPMGNWQQNKIGNEDLSWETTTDTNIGLDFNLLSNRIKFTVDAFKRDTKDLILNVPIFTDKSYFRNIGSIENKGLEFSFSSSNIKSSSFTWDTSFNISFIKNKITKIDYVPVVYKANNETVGESIVRFSPDFAVGAFYGYQVQSVDPQTGSLQYKDLNGNGFFDAADRSVIGNPNPNFTFGFSNQFKFKNLYVDVLITGSQGNDIFNASRLDLELMNDYKNQSSAVLNRWTTPGQITDIPKANDTEALHISDRFVEDGSYVKLKAVTLGYNFKNVFKGISNLNVYVTGQNLYTWTKYSGFDPEVNAYSGTPGIIGIDYGTYPQVRTFIFGIKTTF
ncbi:SusC/RagA family TonB-linked outer membrane protein [Chryseobacterium sp. LC2016-29]|uniref:SusC/RagA family TonB-linked outer membrane protein n=1 Tax=Chryseobacterium sp. LC2016-29 TaxID=2897331 RepID=UPI001E3B6841|nr:SusC/RagA family TonB-linked outer membrane protein [Chryseobacterium sp. LC2016-29]MCD0478830.1 SusC/RagA family TonB-linked outer membrane protein [Chryseobacterium sp. LC2016-29]